MAHVRQEAARHLPSHLTPACIMADVADVVQLLSRLTQSLCWVMIITKKSCALELRFGCHSFDALAASLNANRLDEEVHTYRPSFLPSHPVACEWLHLRQLNRHLTWSYS